MMDAGDSLDKWPISGFSRPHAVQFVCQMLKQVIPALQKLHNLGFSHGDIKPGNICAKYDANGALRFTLIDFGVSSRLFHQGEKRRPGPFRGNLNFASPEHLSNRRASRLDDIYSLLCVAYMFVFHSLPWEDHIEEEYEKASDKSNFFTLEKIMELRFSKLEAFEKTLARESIELRKLF